MHSVQPILRNCFSRTYNAITNNRYVRDLQRRVEEFRLSMQDHFGPRIYDFLFDQEKVFDGKTIYGIRLVKRFVRDERGGLAYQYETYDVLEPNEYKQIEDKRVADPSEDADWQNLRKALKVDKHQLVDTFEKANALFKRAFRERRPDLLNDPLVFRIMEMCEVTGTTYFISAQYDTFQFLPYFIQNFLGRPR